MESGDIVHRPAHLNDDSPFINNPLVDLGKFWVMNFCNFQIFFTFDLRDGMSRLLTTWTITDLYILEKYNPESQSTMNTELISLEKTTVLEVFNGKFIIFEI